MSHCSRWSTTSNTMHSHDPFKNLNAGVSKLQKGYRMAYSSPSPEPIISWKHTKCGAETGVEQKHG